MLLGSNAVQFKKYLLHFQVEGVTSVPPPDKMRTIIESGGGRWVQNLQVCQHDLRPLFH